MTRNRALALTVPCLFGLQLLGLQSASAEDKGYEIALKIEKAHAGYKSEESQMELELIAGSGQKITRKMHGKTQEVGNGEKSIITITWPADQKGTHLLSWSHRLKDDDQWLYLPSLQRVKRISARGKNGSYMGSEFAFEDLVNPWWVEKFKNKFIRDQKVGSRDTWVVERYPADRDSGYSKQLAWMDKEYMAPLRIDYYDRKGKLLKTGSLKSYKKYGKFWRADRFEMVNHQTGKKSNVIFTSRAMGATFSDEEFSPGTLGN